MRRLPLIAVVLGTGLLAAVSTANAQQPTREQKVRGDREKVLSLDDWYYDDLEAGRAEARRTGKPLLVILRCIPCLACEGFDARVLDRDAVIQREMDQFVCVRIVKANSLDLAQFQFDYDLSFAAFLMHADGTIYGRFGTRSAAREHEAEKDISLEGFQKALARAVELHRGYPANRELFKDKRGPRPEFAVPQDFPALKDKESELDYEGNVVQSCIHCHQVRDATLALYRDRKQPPSDEVIHPWPMPGVVGLALDPREMAKVASVQADSPADRAGFKAGDEIVALDGQPLLSIADVQWVLHRADDPGTLAAEVRRGGRTVRLALELPPGWRSASDISWRATSWNLRRMATGGLKLQTLPPADRRRMGLRDGAMALAVEHVGQYGDHAQAKNAGFRKDDVIIAFDGRNDLRTETDLFAHVLKSRMPGERVDVTIVRGGRRETLKLQMR
ncbi:MAG TPA: Trx7/PDZ domain-containing (seleno)protein [Planctomycetaceae bacterium]|nr:Trx7/PDZ domain-containing (seleno)protein [Planctomycetaceae bacterium]